MSDHEKMRAASYLLPDPGGEVVRGLLDEIADLQASLSQAKANTRRDIALMLRASGTCRKGKLEVLAMRESLRELVIVAHRFCRRVEAGEVRSKKTYADFQQALGHPLVKPFLEGM